MIHRFNQMEENIQNNFQVLYICSAARSGSTFTDMFMGGHSQAASLGEINLLGNIISLNADCGCSDKLNACVFWQKIFDAILLSRDIDLIKTPYKFRLWDAIAFDPIDHEWQTRAYRMAVIFRKAWMKGRDLLSDNLRNRFPIPPVLLETLHNKMDLYKEISRCWGKGVIIDSSKNFREAVELHQRWPNFVKVILLTRDGRGVFLSRRSSGRDQLESVKGWLNYYYNALPLLERYIASDSLLKIRYEDLAANPEKIGRILCDFAGISFEPQMLDLAQSTRHMVSGNNTRFSPEKGIRLDERWRTELHGKDLEYFERVGGNMNYRLGYR